EGDHFGPRYQGATDGQLLLLAAWKVAAAPAKHRPEHGKKLENVVGDIVFASGQTRIAGLEIFLDRKEGENLTTLRHIAYAHAGAFVWWRFFKQIGAEDYGTG